MVLEWGLCQANAANTLAEMSKNIEVLLQSQGQRGSKPDGAAPQEEEVTVEKESGASPVAHEVQVGASGSSEGGGAKEAADVPHPQGRVGGIFSVTPAPLMSLSVGQRVRLSGLESVKYEGKKGVIFADAEATKRGRFAVRLDDGQTVTVKREKLVGCIF